MKRGTFFFVLLVDFRFSFYIYSELKSGFFFIIVNETRLTTYHYTTTCWTIKACNGQCIVLDWKIMFVRGRRFLDSFITAARHNIWLFEDGSDTCWWELSRHPSPPPPPPPLHCYLACSAERPTAQNKSLMCSAKPAECIMTFCKEKFIWVFQSEVALVTKKPFNTNKQNKVRLNVRYKPHLNCFC